MRAAGMQKNLGASLLETFTVEQINEHLCSTEEDVAKPVIRSSSVAPATEDPCPVCRALHTLRFEPAPLNCVTCGIRIKRNQMFYRNIKPDAVWCHSCFQAAGEDLYVENLQIKKADVVDKKFKNEQHEDEAWVNCDNPNCGKWVHMICGLFNKVLVPPAACLPCCVRRGQFARVVSLYQTIKGN